MDRQVQKAKLLAGETNSNSENIFSNRDLFEIITKYLDCESISKSCLVNTQWCSRIFNDDGSTDNDNKNTGPSHLRLEVAKCLIRRINSNMIDLSKLVPVRDGENDSQYATSDGEDMEDIDGEESDGEESDGEESNGEESDGEESDGEESDTGWVPGDPLFIEINSSFFHVSLDLPANNQVYASEFLKQNKNFLHMTKEIATALTVLYGVKIHEEILGEPDKRSPYYANFIFHWDQKIPYSNINLLPFTSVVRGHDAQTRMSPISSSNLEDKLRTLDFSKLFSWHHNRRSNRVRGKK